MMYLAFRVRSTRFAIPVAVVREVLPGVALSAIPSGDHALAGLLELRGDALPVVDVGYALSGERSVLTANQRLVIVGGHKRTFALLVDDVDDLLEFPREALLPVTSDGPAWLTHVYVGDEALVLILDIDLLLPTGHSSPIHADMVQ